MKLILPKARQEISATVLEGYSTLVVMGANGSGKSKFGTEIIKRNKQAVKISALNSLYFFVPQKDQKTPVNIICKNSASELSEFERLIMVLMDEEIRESISFREAARTGVSSDVVKETRLDKIRTIWQKILPYSHLLIEDGKLKVQTIYDKSSYDILRMSDSEKIIFYLLGSILLLPPDAIAVVDEPELHINTNQICSLWDQLESARRDCSFIYLTHNIEFAMSRTNSQKFWIKLIDFEHRVWDYDIIASLDNIPEDLYIETLGSRKPILFIEGTDQNSIDIRLYPLIFSDYMVRPLGGCAKVIETTKAFREQPKFHMLNVSGIVDRDRRTDDEVEYLQRNSILVPDVAEVENLLMLEPLIKAVARRMMKPEEIVFAEVKQLVIKLFAEEITVQALLHTRHRVRRSLELMIDRKVTDISELEDHIKNLTVDFDTAGIYDTLVAEFKSFVAKEDYNSILRVYNHKGLLPRSKVFQLCGLSSKESYLNFVISLLKENKEEADEIRRAIKNSLKVE